MKTCWVAYKIKAETLRVWGIEYREKDKSPIYTLCITDKKTHMAKRKANIDGQNNTENQEKYNLQTQFLINSIVKTEVSPNNVWGQH